jgi:hypothetical protein
MASTAMASQGNNQNWHDPSLDPNNTNVPYLAWRGENLRLEKCWNSDDISSLIHQNNPSLDPAWILTDPELSTLFGSIVQTNVQLEDWSGEDTGVNTPKEVINGARTFLWYDLKQQRPVVCFQDTWASQKAGLGQFKLTVSVGLTNLLGSGLSIGAQTLVMQHQWLAGWMSLNAPVLNEVPSRSTSGTAQNPEGLGDMLGDGNFLAGDHWYQDSNGVWQWDTKYGHDGDHPGQLRATITGTLPLGQDYSELNIGSSVTLPTDWKTLATALATDDNRYDSNPAQRWDIHDELVDQFGNTLTGTGGRSNNATDPVANIVNDWSFTRGPVTLWGLTGPHTLLLDSSTSPTAGPFDPNFPNETFLPDGQLNAGDAPMPAARIDFAIAPNTPGSTDGVGSFTSASKEKVYSINDDGSTSPAKNLFAPFYEQYIPATSRDPLGMASGVDGAAVANNFNGFLTYGLTPDWKDFPLVYNTAIKTQCARTVTQGGRDYTDFRYTAGGSNPHYDESGVQTAAVYSDEHGEARINYLPGGYKGDDFYFDSMPNTLNSNGGCDLQAIKVLGTSNINVTARYPYQKVTDPDKTPKTGVTKTVYNLFDKHLSYYQKDLNGDEESTLNKVIVAHAQDINGQPFAGEVVCFSPGTAEGGNFPVVSTPSHPFLVDKADGTTFPVWVNHVVPTPTRYGSGYQCTTLDQNGNAVFEISESIAGTVDVLAQFIDEGISRHIYVLIGPGNESKSSDVPNKTPATVLAAGPATTGAGTNGTTAPTPAQAQTIVNAAIANGFGIIATPAATAGTTATPATITNTITPKVTVTVKKTAKLSLLRLVHPAHAKAYFLIKVSSPNKTAKITVALKNHKGKTISKITKTVAANKLVKIQSSAIKMTITKISLLSVK